MFPKISREVIETALVFLEKQKVANCPCVIHTEHRGFDRVVFRRQPDRLPTNYNDEERREAEDEEDDDYFSVETVEKDEPNVDCKSNCDTHSTNEDHPDEDHSDNPDEPDEDHPDETVDSTLHSRDQEEVSSQQQEN